MPRFTQVADGIYKYGPTGTLYERPYVNGKRTFRALKASSLSIAKIELARKITERRNAEAEGRNPFAISSKISLLAEFYLKAGCPDRKFRARTEGYLKQEEARVKNVVLFFGNMPAEQLTLEECQDYHRWRKKQFKGGKGDRSVDLELNTLSNILTWAVQNAKQTGVRFNPVHRGRPRFQDPEKVRHSRELMPANADDIHKVCGLMMAQRQSESVGWLGLFAYLTGCRMTELVMMRMDAPLMKPGHVDGGYLWLDRAKGGINPFVEIHPALQECMTIHKKWHKELSSPSPWYFPGRDPKQPVEKTSLVKSLGTFCRRSGVPVMTAHSLRAFYVTVLRSKGISDAEIAARIGDKTGAAIIASTYGAVPPNWKAGKQLEWLPSKVPVAWWRWE